MDRRSFRSWAWLTATVLAAGWVLPAASQTLPSPFTQPVSQRVVKHGRTLRVFGQDDRQQVADATAPPWASMGMIVAQWGSDRPYQSRMGTGTLISDRVVVSCAHVVYEPGMGWADHITFYPGHDGGNESFSPTQAESGAVREAWINSRDDNNDISLLLLDRPIGQDTGVMAAASKPVSFFSDRTLNLTGYAGDLAWGILYNASGASTGVNDNLIVHYIDGGPGQSGGPLWYVDDATGRNTIIGIYVGDAEVTQSGELTDVYGIGVRINSELCTWINGFLAANDPTATTSCDAAAGEGPAPACGRGIAGAIPVALVALALMRRTYGYSD